MKQALSDYDFIVRTLVAFSLGCLIGLEREFRNAGAGLRTTALVATGASLFVLTSYQFIGMGEASASRIAAAVVTGIGFLGAGVIFKDGVSVHGLTTAATIWCAAAIGCLAGIGMISWALYGSAVVIFATFALRPVSKLIDKSPLKEKKGE